MTLAGLLAVTGPVILSDLTVAAGAGGPAVGAGVGVATGGAGVGVGAGVVTGGAVGVGVGVAVGVVVGLTVGDGDAVGVGDGVGVGVGVGATAASSAVSADAAFRRPPVSASPLNAALTSTEDSSAAFNCATVAPGSSEASSAATPLTCGAAIEVPLAYW